MRDTDILGALADGAVEHFRRRAVGVLFEEVMFDFPDIVDADVVGEFDLRQCLPVGVVFT